VINNYSRNNYLNHGKNNLLNLQTPMYSFIILKLVKSVVKLSHKLAKNLLILSIISLVTFSCSTTEGEKDQKVKKKRFEPNVDKRAREYADKKPLFSSKRQGGEFQFSTSNVLWRASLNVLEIFPLSNTDYAGGVIITDWYETKNTNNKIKINIRFLSNEISPTAVKVTSYIKKCDTNSNCTTSSTNEKFNNKIKEKILKKARELKIQDENKK
jgi:hypothetical protein